MRKLTASLLKVFYGISFLSLILLLYHFSLPLGTLLTILLVVTILDVAGGMYD